MAGFADVIAGAIVIGCTAALLDFDVTGRAFNVGVQVCLV
jgi:hypothetical protein